MPLGHCRRIEAGIIRLREIKVEDGNRGLLECLCSSANTARVFAFRTASEKVVKGRDFVIQEPSEGVLRIITQISRRCFWRYVFCEVMCYWHGATCFRGNLALC